jgi:hypothetical protein
MKIVIIYPSSDVDKWLVDELKKLGYNIDMIFGKFRYSDLQRTRFKKIKITYSLLLILFKSLLKSITNLFKKEKLLFITWSYYHGIYINFTHKFLFINVRLIALNNLLRKSSGFNKLKDKIVHYVAKKNPYINYTVNNKSQIEKFINNYSISPKKIFIIEDAVRYVEHTFKYIKDNVIFSGGYGNRDWDTLHEAMKTLDPSTNFRLITVSKNKIKADISNYESYYNLPRDQFYSKMNQSKIVIVPLKDDSTAGIIIITEAILRGKLVITAKTKITQAYIPIELEDLLYNLNDSNDLSNKVQLLLNYTKEEYIKKVKLLKSNLVKYNTFNTTKKIEEIVKLY